MTKVLKMAIVTAMMITMIINVMMIMIVAITATVAAMMTPLIINSKTLPL